MIYQINNVMFFSLTSSKYDAVVENGSAFVQQRDPALAYQYQGTQFEGVINQEQFETIRHPCKDLVTNRSLLSTVLIP